MQGITFSRIHTKTFNFVLIVVLLLVATACLAGNSASLNKLDMKWLLSTEFLKLIIILLCYAVPLTYFMTKAIEVISSNSSKSSSVMAFIASSVLLLPLAFIGLVVFAKLSLFVLPALLTIAVAYFYVLSLKPAANKA